MSVDIVVGLQHGDEGKGKVVADLIKRNDYDCCVRFNGGPNAGHTLYLENGQKIVTHHIPSGIIHNIDCVIGPGCVVDLNKLSIEIDMLKSYGIDVMKYLKIAKNCHIIRPNHIDEDIKTDPIGSTHSGIRPVYRDKYDRIGIRMDNYYQDLIPKENIIDTYEFLVNKQNILCEGAQGFELDIDWGAYPYVTSSHCLSGFVCTLGISPKRIRHIYGIAKIYGTYVGNMEYQPKDDLALNKLGELGEEFGSTTSRKRQCNWLNLDSLKRAIDINGCNFIIINKCDIIQQLDNYKLYHNNELHTFKSFSEMNIYIQMVINTGTIIFSGNKNKI